MKKPLVAIVGRPNVGKSTFFNKICGKRISIVDDEPGVTRDRIYADADWCGYNFRMVDTGGLDSKSLDVFQDNIKQQAQIAVDLADVIVFVVDGKDGLTQTDYEVADYLRKFKKDIVLVVNKLDNFEVEKTYEFYDLGLGEPYPISCEQSKGLGEVLDAIVANFNRIDVEEDSDKIKIAIVGKPNVGKSSITNRILGEDRVVVSNVAGTTRDAIESDFRFNNKDYTLIDTAGLRRKRGIENETVESYSVIRSMEAIKRADVVIIVFDSSEPISEQDVRIAGYVHQEGKPSVVVMNKWDKIENKDGNTMNKYLSDLKMKLSFMDYFVPVFTSAVTGQRLFDLMEKVNYVYENSCKRIPTGNLNELLANAIISNEPPYRNGRKLKIQYITQVSTCPPSFVLFVNDSSLMHFSYLRYLENKFRDSVDFSGTPVKFIVRSKESED